MGYASHFDTFVETRNHTNIATSKHDERTERCGLLDALAYFGISLSRNRTTEEKDYWRQLFIDDGPWTPSLQAGGLDYCADDVLDTEQLFYRVLRTVNSLPEAFNRGRFMAAAAKVERVGIPIYMPTFIRFRQHRETLMRRLIEEVDRNIGIYVGTSINQQRFARWLRDVGIDEWPLTDAGHFKTDKDTFRDMEGAHPSIERLKELQKTLTGLKNNDLEDAIGADGRNRTGVRPFGASSSRNTPRAGEFVFGQAKWNRCLIKPEPGYSIGSFDYKQQEYAIAAVYSGDKAMLAAYQSGDPYKASAIQAGFEPTPTNRSKFKTVSLGIQYGAGPSRLSRQLGLPRQQTRELVQLHKRMHPDYWDWVERVGMHATLHNELQTRFGWKIRPVPMQRHNCPGVYTDPPNIRTLRNFPCQGNGGEILREATCRLVDDGVDVCALVHDAIVIISPTHRFKEDVAKTLRAMRDASQLVLDGFTLGIDSNLVSYPDSYIDEKGIDMWNLIYRLMAETEAQVA